MLKNPWFVFSMFVFLFIGGCVFMITSTVSQFVPNETSMIRKDSILRLDLEGVILDGEKFLEDLNKYAKEDHIKGILIRVNSPGGVVGPSQEIYAELMRIRKETKKPIFFSANALMASGAYYAAVGADKIYVNPGTLMGSIGVIMEFANLSELYQWAKVQRYALTTGQYKSTGTDTRAMRDDEKELMQSLLNEVFGQFKEAVATGRNLKMDQVVPYADGRVITGAMGVKLGFADKVGTYTDAVRDLGQLTGLGDNPEIFQPKRNENKFLDMISGKADSLSPLKMLKDISGLELVGKPLFMMPQYFQTATIRN